MHLTPLHLDAVRLALQRLIQDWRQLDEHHRPWGAWVRLHAPIDTARLNEGEPLYRVPLVAAWFLSTSGLVRQDPWSYLRFEAVHLHPLWCLPHSGAHLVARPAIGIMAVAPCNDTPAAYFEAQFAPRFGYGRLLAFDGQKNPDVKDLWRS